MTEKYRIRRATPGDDDAAAELMLLLWPEHTPDALRSEAAELIAAAESALFLAETGGRAAGFAQCGLRHDYVEGTEHSPVGYLEGLYVRPEHRRNHVGLLLERACEDWARAHGCREMGSDCELSNTLSPLFHAGAGFAEANRIVCFVKPL